MIRTWQMMRDGCMRESTLECPCCGDVAATADADGLFDESQDIECGCTTVWVSCSAEETAHISYDDCEACRKCEPEPRRIQ